MPWQPWLLLQNAKSCTPATGYSRDRAQNILNTWIKNKGLEQQAEWLQSPQAIRVVALTSEAMNKSCNDFDQNSPQFIPAMEAIDAI